MNKRSPLSRPSRRIQAVAPSATKLMAQRAAAIDDTVSLGQGVPGFAPPEEVLAAVQEVIATNGASSNYSLQNGLPELRRRLAQHLFLEKEVELDPDEELCITVGGMEGLLAAILTVVDEGDEVLLPSPTYASYSEQILLAGGRPVYVPLGPKWELDFTRLEAALTPGTRAILLCNPGNPTGNVYTDQEIQAICRLAVERGLVVIIDEAYDYMIYGGKQAANPLAMAPYRDHVISIGSLSKKYCLTGWRVGWVAARPHWMEHIMKVHDAATICAPTPSQYAALAALETEPQWVEECCRRLDRRRQLCCRRLDELHPYFSYVPPRGAFYIMARYLWSEEASDQVAIQLLEETGVITVPGGSFGLGGEGHLRLSFGGTEATINTAFDRLGAWLGSSY
ncbi:pyridoxal phosphate-dependent aminotransferase [Desulfogranum mediterraneum]|uniref:pyridoxal phosphate-dependent aminotransferase n=1 Tax=Desulfogranum mediterraneum TaxID=160661 RepID=UPI000402D0FE|nr:pyridoxal phosphate-dependent aminotransferase [Desulfogranum mediterraneum]